MPELLTEGGTENEKRIFAVFVLEIVHTFAPRSSPSPSASEDLFLFVIMLLPNGGGATRKFSGQ